MEIPIIIRFGTQAEYEASTKPVKAGEMFAIKGKGIYISREAGPINSVPVEEYTKAIFAQQTAPGMFRCVSTQSDTTNSGSVGFVIKSSTGYAAIRWWDGTVEILGNGAPGSTISFSKFVPISGAWSKSSPKEIYGWSCTVGNAQQSGDLTLLNCNTNELTYLDVSGLTSLTHLYCGVNRLTQIDLSGLTELVHLTCGGNNLVSLDVAGLQQLDYLACDYNHLTYLDVSGMPALTQLNCSYNQLTSLDVSGSSALYILNCHNNQLPSLDLSGLSALYALNCQNNQLSSLDLSVLSALGSFNCTLNLLTSLELGSGPFAIGDASDNPSLVSLTVGDNFDALGGGYAHPYGISFQYGLILHNTALSGAVLNALYQKLTETPSSSHHGAGYIYLKDIQDPEVNPCVGWDSDDPSLAPAAWTIYGT